MRARAIPAAEFKNSCLKLMEEVHKHGIPITVTKRGKPLVRVVPAHDETAPRSLRGVILFEADDIFSTGESWNAES